MGLHGDGRHQHHMLHARAPRGFEDLRVRAEARHQEQRANPASAGSSEAGRAKSPSTASTPSGNTARLASRVSARNGPASTPRSSAKRALPMFPVAPVTRIMRATLGPQPDLRSKEPWARGFTGCIRSIEPAARPT